MKIHEAVIFLAYEILNKVSPGMIIATGENRDIWMAENTKEFFGSEEYFHKQINFEEGIIFRKIKDRLFQISLKFFPVEEYGRVLIHSLLDITESVTDPLTGLYNRRFFNEALKKAINRSSRYGGSVTLAMIDIDFFKKINDDYGHQAGDEVLKVLGQRLKASFRNTDIVTRYGGEEFAVIMPQTDIFGAENLLERIRSRIGDCKFLFQDQEIEVTVSIGVAEYSYSAVSVNSQIEDSDLIEEADKALYKAKEGGRNRVVVA